MKIKQILDEVISGSGVSVSAVTPPSPILPARKKKKKEKIVQESIQSVRLSIQRLGMEEFITERDGIITVHRILVPKSDRKQGIGSTAMKIITDYADMTNQIVALSPDDSIGATSKGRLIEFYKRFGFIKNTGGKRNFRISETMIRYPK